MLKFCCYRPTMARYRPVNGLLSIQSTNTGVVSVGQDRDTGARGVGEIWRKMGGGGGQMSGVCAKIWIWGGGTRNKNRGKGGGEGRKKLGGGRGVEPRGKGVQGSSPASVSTGLFSHSENALCIPLSNAFEHYSDTNQSQDIQRWRRTH